MSRLDAHQHTTTYVPLQDARKLANKERRKAGRERHEQRKEQAKDLSSVHKWRHHENTHQRQEKRRDDGARVFAGLNLDNHRETASHVHASEDTDADKWHAWRLAVLDRVGADIEKHFGESPAAVQRETSGEMLLAMARPARPRRGARRRQSAATMTDGEPFEVVEVDGRLVALDEDGWEILPDENAGPSLLYSDIVRGTQ